MRRMTTHPAAAVLALALTIVAANWFIANVGQCAAPGDPCVVPVWPLPLLMAPSGVLWIGLALVIRDWLHEAGGRAWVLAAVVLGALLSAALGPALAVASGVAFAVSELLDYAVYARLRARGRPVAVLLSGVAGAAADSALFLWLAFGSLDFIAGQIVGKVWMSALAAALLWAWQRRAARAAVAR